MTCCGCGQATRSWWTARCSTGAPVEADESLLTGESEPVVKEPGDDLRSGSLCVAARATTRPATSAPPATPAG